MKYHNEITITENQRPLTGDISDSGRYYKLTEDNEYRHYLYCKLSSIKCELERQLTNLTNPPKLKEQTAEDDD